MNCTSSNGETYPCANTPVFLWDYQDKTDGHLLSNYRNRPMCKPCAEREQARFWKYTLWNVADADSAAAEAAALASEAEASQAAYDEYRAR